MQRDYNDIINLPHKKSETRPHMTAEARAVQFAPFAALTGYDAAIRETARLTDQRRGLDEETAAKLNRRIEILREKTAERPTVEIVHFVADSRKSGGEYVKTSGRLRKIDEVYRKIILESGTEISVENILSIDGDF